MLKTRTGSTLSPFTGRTLLVRAMTRMMRTTRRAMVASMMMISPLRTATAKYCFSSPQSGGPLGSRPEPAHPPGGVRLSRLLHLRHLWLAREALPHPLSRTHTTIVVILVLGGPAPLSCRVDFVVFVPVSGWPAKLSARQVTIVVIVLLATLFATRKTAVDLFLESIGDNQRAAHFAGINTRVMKALVYSFSGFCAGIAGLIATSNIKAADSSRVGEMMELDAIFAVVVGGTALTGGRFSLVGSIIGALLIQTLTTTMYNLGVSPSVAPVPKAVVIIAVCLLQSGRFREQFIRLRQARPANA